MKNKAGKKLNRHMNKNRFIGCCGAYCRACGPFIEGACKGCKLGFDTGERDIGKAKCKIKLCCFKDRKFITCADCPELDSCGLIGGFFDKMGRKYKKYRQALEFIRKYGYREFIRSADKWTGAYGSLEK